MGNIAATTRSLVHGPKPWDPEYDREAEWLLLKALGPEGFRKVTGEAPSPELVAEVEQAKATEPQPAHA